MHRAAASTSLEKGQALSGRWKSRFVMPFFTLEVLILAVAATRLLREGFSVSWAGTLLVPGAFLSFLGFTLLSRRARTSADLHPVLGASAFGLFLAVTGSLRGGPALAAALSAGGFGALVAYVYWYSRFGRQHAAALSVGAILPDFMLEDVSGGVLRSSSFRGSPAVFLFYRGNWCPLCMAQIREIAGAYRDLASRGVRVALVSPQPAEHSRALAARFEVPLEFLVDRGCRAARDLGIFHPEGLPAGMQVLGYEEDTVLPTVIVTDADGRIVFVDETDNYRVRPEPATFLAALDGAR